jgi:hypothetical protein
MLRFSLLVVAAALLGGEAPRPLAAQSPDGPVLADTRVVVSRHEVRVVFPRDSGAVWDWRFDGPELKDMFRWWIEADGVDREVNLGVFSFLPGLSLGVSILPPAGESPELSSARTLLAHGEALVCVFSRIHECSRSGASLEEDGGRVVVVLRDSAVISRWFGPRPRTVSAWHRPSGSSKGRRAGVDVEYVDSQISAIVAEDTTPQGEGLPWSSRSIGGGDPRRGEALSLAVGDSAVLRVEESRCRSEICPVERVRYGGTWAVLDTSVARLGPEDGDPRPRSSRTIFALRPGRTRVHVSNPPPDSLVPPPLELFRDVVVTRSGGWVEILTNSQSFRMGEAVVLRAQVFDREGTRLPEAPVRLEIAMGSRQWVYTVSEPLSWEPEEAGRYTVTATFGELTATWVIDIRPASPR